MREKNNMQEILLTKLCREQQPITVFLMNGYRLRGTIVGFDAFMVALNSDGKQMFIYKHAISTIVPEESVLPEKRHGDGPWKGGNER